MGPTKRNKKIKKRTNRENKKKKEKKTPAANIPKLYKERTKH